MKLRWFIKNEGGTELQWLKEAVLVGEEDQWITVETIIEEAKEPEVAK